MSGNRVVYQNWIVEIGFDPAQLKAIENWNDPPLESISLDEPSACAISDEESQRVIEEREKTSEIRSRVRKALERLSVQEREFIAQFYFMGRSYREISEQSGRPIHKLEALHKRAVKKLKNELGGFVRERFGVETGSDADCLICRSPHLAEINRLISRRDKTTTWKPIIKTLRNKYGLKVSSPQMLIGHEKYHGRSPTGTA
ncbi:unnamed protein product [marine sediment metagenome]|uniref:RNA polymerase sigma factor 70 region 4 type 2 domain-containing protein n=1 Tax=marine sediment metagenome TaxID=412755 RepID=X0SIE3_9ZZZZ